MAMYIFDPAYPKSIENLLAFLNLHQHAKKSAHSNNSFMRYSQVWIPLTRLDTPTFDHATQNIFDQILIYVNLYQHAKKSGYFMICSGDMVD